MLEIIIASLAVMAVSLVGVISVWKHVGEAIERNLSFLVSFSAGVFLIIAGNLVIETFEHAAEWGDALFFVLLGAVGILVVFKLLPSFHHHHDEHEEAHLHSRVDAKNILAGDAIHNIGDGVLIAAAFAVGTPFGWAAAASIAVHELVQEISEFFVLKQAGFTTKKALLWNLASSSTILIGSIGGYFLLDSFEMLEVPLLGIAAGAFLIVVFHDLIPHSVRSSGHRVHHFKHIAWFVVGLAVMWGVSAALPHAEEGEGHEEEALVEVAK